MADQQDFTQGFLLGYLLQQSKLQQQLIETQQEVIRLQQKVEQLTPPYPDEDVNWNKVSGGLTSVEVLESDDLEKVRALREWIFHFGEKYIRRFVHQRAYSELIAHMTRGIPRRLAELEVMREFGGDDAPPPASNNNKKH